MQERDKLGSALWEGLFMEAFVVGWPTTHRKKSLRIFIGSEEIRIVTQVISPKCNALLVLPSLVMVLQSLLTKYMILINEIYPNNTSPRLMMT